jgi:hypothetical protein
VKFVSDQWSFKLPEDLFDEDGREKEGKDKDGKEKEKHFIRASKKPFWAKSPISPPFGYLSLSSKESLFSPPPLSSSAIGALSF